MVVLLKVHGVRHLTALTFVLTLGSKERWDNFMSVAILACNLGQQTGCLAHRPRLNRSHPRKLI